MRKIWRALGIGFFMAATLGCSVGQRQAAQKPGWQEKGFRGLVETCGEPKTTMTLPNGNLLYIIGKGKGTMTEIRVRSVPGHERVMISGDGRPAKMARLSNDTMFSYHNQSQDRIVWIEINEAGNIIVAGCSGCTAEEDHLLAEVAKDGAERNLVSSLRE